MKKIFVAAIALLFVMGALPVQSKTILATDASLISETITYDEPNEILIVPILARSVEESREDSTDRFKGILYYSVSRLGFADIPFHYIVDQQGNIFKGSYASDEARIPLNYSKRPVIVGYLAEYNDTSFNPRSFTGFGNLLIEIANRNAINLENMSIKRFVFAKNASDKTVKIEVKEVFGLWQSSLNTIVDQIKSKFSPSKKTYALEIGNIQLPQSKVQVNSRPKVTFDVKNVGENTIYQGSGSELFATFTGSGTSKFFVNNTWASTKDATFMGPNEHIRPGETKTYSFELATPLFFDGLKERFVLRNNNQTFANTAFDITLQVEKPSGRIVEVKKTEVGYLRVRADASVESPEISRLSAGQRYLVLEDLGNGWIKLKIDATTEGWVSSLYTFDI